MKAIVQNKYGPPGDVLTIREIDKPAITDDEVLDAMVQHPVLINRPLVETPKGVRLCRPQEMVREIL